MAENNNRVNENKVENKTRHKYHPTKVTKQFGLFVMVNINTNAGHDNNAGKNVRGGQNESKKSNT